MAVTPLALVGMIALPLQAGDSRFDDFMAHFRPENPLLVDYDYQASYFPDPSRSLAERDAAWAEDRRNIPEGVYEMNPHRMDFDRGGFHGSENPVERGALVVWRDRGLADLQIGWYGETPYKYYRNQWWYDEVAYPGSTVRSIMSGQMEGRVTFDRQIHSPINSFLMAAGWLPFMLEPLEHETVSIVDSCRSDGAELFLVRNVASHDGDWYYLFAPPDDRSGKVVLRSAARLFSEPGTCRDVLGVLRSDSVFVGDHVQFENYREIEGARLPSNVVWRQYRPRSRPGANGESVYRFLEATFVVTNFDELDQQSAEILLQSPFEELPEVHVRDWTVPLDDEPFAFNWEYVYGKSDAEQRDFAVEFVRSTYLSEEDIRERRRARAPTLPTYQPWYMRWLIPAGGIAVGLGLIFFVSYGLKKRRA